MNDIQTQDDSCACGHDHGVNALMPHDGKALISARGLWLTRYGRHLVAGVDLDVHANEIVTLIGPNGAGKSTLVKLILGIEKPDRGSIARSATRIGYVPQRFDIDRTMPMTVAGFLMLGGKPLRAAVETALAEAGVARAIGQQLASLSGGETQRVLIARALLRDPQLLVLDEPASGVDYAGEADLYELIARLKDKRKLGVLLVSHDLHVVMARSDRVLCLNGHVCCSGRPDVVAQHSEYVRMFGNEAAKALALYHHHHDHAHDIAGNPRPIAADAPSAAPSGHAHPERR